MADDKAKGVAVKSSGGVDPKLLQLADQLGTLLGTARAKADQWLDREALSRELARIRDGAADLLAQVNRAAEASRKAATTPRVAAVKPVDPVGGGKPSGVDLVGGGKPSGLPLAAPPASRGPVDAPGKRHRKPPPQVRLDKRMGEVVGKKMGKKNVKHAMKGRA